MKQNPYALAIIGLMVAIFGIVDIAFVNVYVGILLLVAGAFVGYAGLNRAKQAASSKK